MKIIITEEQLKTLMESIEPSSVKGALIKLGIPNSVIDSFGSPIEGSWVVRVKTNKPWPMDTLSISYPAMDDELTNPDDTKVSVKIGKKEFNTSLNDATKQVSSKYKELKVLSEIDYRNLDDLIKFGEFSEHFKKEDLKKINKFLLLIKKLGVVNMFQAGDFFLMSIEYFRDFMKLKSYEREYDEDVISEIEEMMPDISSIIINAGINLVEKNNIEVTPKSVENAIKRLVSSIMKYYMTQNLPNVNESKNNFFSSEPLNTSTDSHFMFTQVGKGYYQVVPFVSFPDEFYNYISSLGNDLESEIMDHLVSRVYIEASGDFNRIHFREGIHPELQGTGLGYLIYQDFIKFLGFASSSDSATKDSKKVWQKLLNDPDFYGVFCEGDNVLIVSKNWNGDTSSLFKTFISKKN
jgi:hypothetical protein